ncbi:MAG: domain containing rane protein [Bacteriovoracaceae bacterium]|nr:domain containing rane protein [Bacteriovoracaceae bacterium]
MQTIRDLMTENVKTIHPEEFLRVAARKMKKYNIGALPVCDGHKLRGILTDRDIVIRSDFDRVENLKVKDVMSPKIIFGYDDQNLEEAAELMQKEHIRRLPILNGENRLVGLLSLDDLVKGENELAAKTLRGIMKMHAWSVPLKALARPKIMGPSAAVLGTLAAAGAYFFWRRNHSKTSIWNRLHLKSAS